MTYCPNCGAQPVSGAPVCPRCGKPAGAPVPLPVRSAYPAYPAPPAYMPPRVPAGTNSYALIGFIMAWLPVPVIGLLLCIMGLVQCARTGQKGRGLAVAGIVLRVLLIALAVAGIVFLFNYIENPDLYYPDYGAWEEPFAFAALR